MSNGMIGVWVLILLAAVSVYFVERAFKARQRDRDSLHDHYMMALQSGDKRKALDAGRRYYSFVRGGKLTQLDELAILNDLTTMP